MVYFRANDAGACDYFQDSRWGRLRLRTLWQLPSSLRVMTASCLLTSYRTHFTLAFNRMVNFPLRRYWRYSHGTTWAELADDLLVVDVPGDHFSLLRQEPADMEPLVGNDLGL